MPPNDPHDLARFTAAQAPVWDTVRAELRAGRKTSHWMWFIFPQLAGLGQSPMARRYAITGLPEARAYLAHPTLGPRLHEAVTLTLAAARPAYAIFGEPDTTKLRSSLTLFEAAGAPFAPALDQLYEGQRDPATLRLLA